MGVTDLDYMCMCMVQAAMDPHGDTVGGRYRSVSELDRVLILRHSPHNHTHERQPETREDWGRLFQSQGLIALGLFIWL